MYEKAKYRKKQLAFKQAVFYFAPQLELSGWPKIIKIGFKEGCKIVLLYILNFKPTNNNNEFDGL